MILSEIFRSCKTEQELNDCLKRDDVAAEISTLKALPDNMQFSYLWARNAWVYYRDLLRQKKTA